MSHGENFEAAKAALFRWRDENAPGTHACVCLECWQHATAPGSTETTLRITVATPTGVIATTEMTDRNIDGALKRLATDKAMREAALEKVRREIAEAAAAEKGDA